MPSSAPAGLLIGLMGAECTGKTTLAAALSSQVGARVVREALRDFVRAHGRPPTADEQAALMAAQQEAIAAALAGGGAGQGVVIADPHPAMTAVYSQVYFDDASLDDRAIELLRACDVVVWCQPGIPWVPDPGQRDGEPWRAAAHDRIGPLLDRAGIVPVIADGPLAARVARVRSAIARLGSSA